MFIQTYDKQRRNLDKRMHISYTIIYIGGSITYVQCRSVDNIRTNLDKKKLISYTFVEKLNPNVAVENLKRQKCYYAVILNIYIKYECKHFNYKI